MASVPRVKKTNLQYTHNSELAALFYKELVVFVFGKYVTQGTWILTFFKRNKNKSILVGEYEK